MVERLRTEKQRATQKRSADVAVVMKDRTIARREETVRADWVLISIVPYYTYGISVPIDEVSRPQVIRKICNIAHLQCSVKKH